MCARHRNANSPAKLYARVALNTQGEYWQARWEGERGNRTYIHLLNS